MGYSVHNDIVFYTRISVYVAWLVTSIRIAYHTVLEGYIALLGSEYYYYLPVLLIILILIFIDRIRGFIPNIDIYDVLAAVPLILLSILIYISGYAAGAEILLYISMITWFWSWIMIMLGIKGVRKAIYVVAASYLLVPVPREAISDISRELAFLSARTAAAVTGADMWISGGTAFLNVNSAEHMYIYRVAQSCSGVISLLSLIPFSAAALYIAIYYTSGGFRGRVLRSAAVLTAPPPLVVLGNTARFILIISATSIWGGQAAMQLFHTAPSLLYASIIQTIILILLIKRYERRQGRKHVSKHVSRNKGLRQTLGYIAIALLVPTSLLISWLPSGIGARTNGNMVIDIDRHHEAVQRLLKEIRGLTLISLTEMKSWEVDTGVPIIYSGHGVYGEATLYFVVEISPSKMLFHEWPVCLISQGYSVITTRTYKPQGEDYEIHYISYTKNGAAKELYYLVAPLMGSDKSLYYIKITFMGQGAAAGKAAAAAATLLSDDWRGETGSTSYLEEASFSLSAATLASIIVAVAVLFMQRYESSIRGITALK